MAGIKANRGKESRGLFKLLTSGEVAERLRCSRGWVQENHKRKGLHSVKIGRQYLFPSDALELWIQAQETYKLEQAPSEGKKLQTARFA